MILPPSPSGLTRGNKAVQPVLRYAGLPERASHAV